jgi:hypothetical protein
VPQIKRDNTPDTSDRTGLPQFNRDQTTWYQPRARSSLCSTSVSPMSNRRAIEGRFVRLSASSLRPERRSDDGQMILKMARADPKPPLTWQYASPLTESNRRPSPYHLEFPRFTSRPRVPQASGSATLTLVVPCDHSGHGAGRGTRPLQAQARRAAGSSAPGMPLRPGPWGSVPPGHIQADGQTTVRRSLAAGTAGPQMPRGTGTLPLPPSN